jgi:uncharacterized glyoxalase superfamily protein PhnB
MKLEVVTPMLRTKRLREAIQFYEAVLGFVCREYDEDWGWASLGRDGVAIMLASPNAHEPFDRPAFTGSLYFRTDDVDALWTRVRDRARVCYPIENFEYGQREFAIYDGDGYLLQFGSPIVTKGAGGARSAS